MPAPKKIALLIAVCAAAGAAAYGVTQYRSAEAVPASRAWGTVDARHVRLAFEGQGRIAKLYKDAGDRVKAGDLLGELDTVSLSIELARAKAQADAAEAQRRLAHEGSRKEDIEAAKADLSSAQHALTLARQTEKRQNELLRTGGTTQQLRESAQAERAVREAAVEAASARLKKLEDGLRAEEIQAADANAAAARAAVELTAYRLNTAAKLIAPADGVLRSRLLEPGAMAVGSLPVFELALTDPKRVYAYVTETQLRFVKEGSYATVTSDTTAPMKATVGWISPEAQFTPKSVQTQDLRTVLVYEVQLTVEDPQNALRLGQPVTVDFGEH